MQQPKPSWFKALRAWIICYKQIDQKKAGEACLFVVQKCKTSKRRYLKFLRYGGRDAKRLHAIALISVMVFMSLGVSQARGACYDVSYSGAHIAFVKNPALVSAAVDMAKKDHQEKTGQVAIRPASVPIVEKQTEKVEQSTPVAVGELAAKLGTEVQWIVPAVVVPVSQSNLRLAFKDESVAQAVLDAVVAQGKNRPLPEQANDHKRPKPSLENADAELASLHLDDANQTALAPTVYTLESASLFDDEMMIAGETIESELLNLEQALEKIKAGHVLTHKHLLAPGESKESVAQTWQMSLTRLEELNPDLTWGTLAPGTEIVVERLEPLVRDRTEVKEVKQVYDCFSVTYVDDPNLMIGQYAVASPGKYGIKSQTSTVVYAAGFEQMRTLVSEVSISQPVAAVVRRGTSLVPKIPWPVLGVISSPFGERSWLDGEVEFHRGLDIAAPRGSEVLAVLSGTVTYADTMGTYGNVVFIDHGNGFSTRYAHLDRIDVKVGQQLLLGEVLGAVGNTGNSTGPHLHLETLINNEPKDPMHFLQGNLEMPTRLSTSADKEENDV